MILDPLARRRAGSCFYLVVGGDCDAAIAAAQRDAIAVERAVKLLLDGDIDDEEFCEMVEDRVPCMDAYLTEVAGNINASLH